jgi:hypothetical protein
MASARLGASRGLATLERMNAEAIRELLRRRPFEPFDVHMSNGEV